jgi:hypothetical protein
MLGRRTSVATAPGQARTDEARRSPRLSWSRHANGTGAHPRPRRQFLPPAAVAPIPRRSRTPPRHQPGIADASADADTDADRRGPGPCRDVADDEGVRADPAGATPLRATR